jgi:23S rRNA pseudouridine1911/1915/1917 synthase
LVIVVGRAESGARLDRFLAGALDVSRSELQRWIAAGRVTVDGVARDAGARVREGERVAVEPMARATTVALPEEGIAFEVLYVDDEVVVVNKPAGLVVHPARGNESGTLVNGLLARGLFAAEEGENERPGVVHRLDKGTSGVMVVARTPAAREALKAQFQAHTIERAYRAIAVGDARQATHDTLYGRHSHDRMRFTTHVRSGKRAVTHVRPLERLAAGATYVECTLQTGRTHQIRVHLAESGTPVLGDPVYGRAPRDPRLRAVGERLGHQALHARVLGFEHPGGRHLRFEAEPPPDFVATLEELRRDPG